MPRPKISEAVKQFRHDTAKRLNIFSTYFIGDNILRKKKLRYLEALTQYHFHSFAILHTQGAHEYEFRKWLREDDAFMEACNVVRLAWIDRLEYAVVAKSGFYGPERAARWKGIETLGMCHFLRVARQHGIYRRLKVDGGKGQAGLPSRVSRDGEGETCAVVETGREGDLLAVPKADVVPQEP